MQLTCPECGAKISAQNINIEQMIAVCPECDTVFQFDPPGEKAKRRKVKQPEHLTAHESDQGVNLSFRTNFRLDQNEAFIITGILSAIFTLGLPAVLGDVLAGDLEIGILIPLLLVISFLYYLLGLIVYNKTHIDVTDAEIRVSRGPLPSPFSHTHHISLAGIKHIHYAETPVSIREVYDTPRYTVYAVMDDGTQTLIVTDVINDYAVYLTQRLNAALEDSVPPPYRVQQTNTGETSDRVTLSDLFDDEPQTFKHDN